MKDIPGYEGLYAITSCGRVWSYRNKCFLKPYKNSFGYLIVGLFKNGNRQNYKIHRLAAQSFIPNPNNYPEVNHKNENKEDNYINNLEWCTHEYNQNYGTRNKRISEKLKKKCKCMETNKIYDSAKAAAEALNYKEKSVNQVCRGERRSLFGLHFIYIENK